VSRLSRFRQALILLLLLAVAALLLLFPPRQEVERRAPVPTPVVTDRVERADLAPLEEVSGYLQPVRRAWLTFEVAGRVVQRRVEPGQSVAAGAVLLALEDGDYRDVLERDRRLLELAVRSRKLQEQEVERLRRLGERSLASKTRLGDAEALLVQRLSEEARLRAAVDRAERDLARSRLRAPFAGRVNQVMLELGDYARKGDRAVQLVASRLDFVARVRGDVARSLAIGAPVQVQVGERLRTADVVAVQPDPDPATFTHEVRLRLPPEETRDGMTARARLPLPPLKAVLVVPDTAVLLDEDGAWLFRLAGDRLQRVQVQPGPRVGRLRVILEGIDEGDRVVVRDVAALADGQLVTVSAAADGE